MLLFLKSAITSFHIMVTNIHHSFFSSPQDALDVVQICKEDQEQAFAMLAAVLWLGNISLQVIDNENHVEVFTNEGKIGIILSKLNCQLSILANNRQHLNFSHFTINGSGIFFT